MVARRMEREHVYREHEREPFEDRPEQIDAHGASEYAPRLLPCEWKRGHWVNDRNPLWLQALGASIRLRSAVREHWKRILVGAAIGWVFAVVGGAFALASLEFHHVISPSTSDEVGIVVVLYGVGIGALNAYALRPARE
jgi:drug/metabolite transporter superfamily protein YnfA